MEYTENKEKIINDNLKWADKNEIEEFLNDSSFSEWIESYKEQKITDPIEQWISSGIRLWKEGML
jgi:hypothetical protein